MKKLICFLSLTYFAQLPARPAQDQILLPPPKAKGMRILRNKNITYTNENIEEPKKTDYLGITFAVKGRSKPDRLGKVISQLTTGSLVKPFKWSRDKKWLAVVVKSSGVRVWLPKAALPEIDAEFKLLKAKPAPSSPEPDSEADTPSEE